MITYALILSCIIAFALGAGLLAGYLISNLRTELRTLRERVDALDNTLFTNQELREENALLRRHDQEK